ncbi:MAG: alpha/beta fold hydrolase [Woeseiaceae bacterium]|nr:alpha/beta fold hydrolase [Woeseiaceae bacterium]
MKYTLLTVIALLALAVLLEGLTIARDTRTFPMPGRLVDIGSHEMHVWCEGEGRPTVILDAGAIAFSTSWRAVLPLVAQTTRVCAFDRSGLGWSEAGPGPWDGDQAADELALLLTASGIDEPVIYAGHSLGAMLARIFADRYPERLAGLVLIEPADPEIIIGEINEERETPINRDMPDSTCGFRCPIAVFMALTGLPRWMLKGQDILNDQQLPELAVKEFVARSVRPSNIRHLVFMGRYFPRIFFQTLDNTSLGSTPVVFVYGTRSGELLGDHTSLEEWQHDYDAQLVAWQRTGETSANFLGMREVPDANHLSIVTYPEHAEAVAGVIREMHEHVRDQGRKEDTNEAASWRLTAEWQLSVAFRSPESAIYDARREVVYVSNVNGYEENGEGFLSTISTRGELLELKWIQGLNAPTGMAISGDILYVVDFNRLVAIDIPNRRIRAQYPSPDELPGLNDVTVDSNGSVFVSGSESETIYQLSEGKLRRWIQSDELKYANGLHVTDRFLYVSGFYLRRIDREPMEIQDLGFDERLEDLESIEPDGKGGYFITQIGDKPIMHWSESGELTTVLPRSTYSADIDFIADQNLLIVPSGGNTVVGFSAARLPSTD